MPSAAPPPPSSPASDAPLRWLHSQSCLAPARVPGRIQRWGASLACFQAGDCGFYKASTASQYPIPSPPSQTSPEKEEDGSRSLSSMDLGAPRFQVGFKQLQQLRVQLLGFVKDKRALLAAPLRLLHLPLQLLLYRTWGAAALLCPQPCGTSKSGLHPPQSPNPALGPTRLPSFPGDAPGSRAQQPHLG